ncbi:MAG TPA: metal-dependent hydrolase [Burkholderiales bacterium]|nr:metal-dependent hydrolase [Burkholderiales bacterium]
MDTLTHALSGALAARATAPANARISLTARVTAGFFAAAFPDMDWVLAYVSPVAYITGHRGVTHSVLLLPLWAGLLAWLCAKIGRGGATWRDYYGVCAIALGMHILGDLITSFGTIVFAPVSDARIAWSTTFIIDLWFTGIIAAGLAATWVWRRSRVPAVLGLATLAGYVGLQAVLHSRAVDVGADYARRQGLDGVRVSAVPRPVSPFNWMIVITERDRYRYANVNLLRERIPPAPRPDAGLIERLDAAYVPVADARWSSVAKFGESPAQRMLASAVWGARDLEFFRWFADYPVLYRIDAGNPSRCVWFEDLRFNTAGREGNPFRFGVCNRDGSHEWTAYRLRDDGTREPAR